MEKTITNSSKETENFGESFAKTLQPGDCICLFGELGAGKTTLVQGIAKGLGIGERVISPTFALVREHTPDYTITTIQKMYHIDLYRFENPEDVRRAGIYDLMQETNVIVLIEWAERIEALLPKRRVEIRIASQDDTREIMVTRVPR
jgi:tRNA threonylcarbamoyladenosine biosynthesis protein TsaE